MWLGSGEAYRGHAQFSYSFPPLRHPPAVAKMLCSSGGRVPSCPNPHPQNEKACPGQMLLMTGWVSLPNSETHLVLSILLLSHSKQQPITVWSPSAHSLVSLLILIWIPKWGLAKRMLFLETSQGTEKPLLRANHVPSMKRAAFTYVSLFNPHSNPQ